MKTNPRLSVPEGRPATRMRHSIAFYETDAMGIVHHSNYLRFMERARVCFLAEHDRPYREYVADGIHVPVTRASVVYHQPTRFADEIEVSCWLAWARHASLGFAYRLEVAGAHVASGETDHAIIDDDGRPMRIPPRMRERVNLWLGAGAP